MEHKKSGESNLSPSNVATSAQVVPRVEPFQPGATLQADIYEITGVLNTGSEGSDAAVAAKAAEAINRTVENGTPVDLAAIARFFEASGHQVYKRSGTMRLASMKPQTAVIRENGQLVAHAIVKPQQTMLPTINMYGLGGVANLTESSKAEREDVEVSPTTELPKGVARIQAIRMVYHNPDILDKVA